MIQTAVLAGGCFWCMVAPFEAEKGVLKVRAGYTGGAKPNPTYEEVCSGKSGHVEVVQVEFDASQISYEKILDIFWRQIDPTDAGGQFYDRGSQYQTAIYYVDDQQKELAQKSKKALAQSGVFSDPIVTKIVPLTQFYSAEEYHQDYHKKNPTRYQFYKLGSGREDFLKGVWDK